MWINLSLQWRHNERDGISITNLTIVHSIVYSGADKRKYQSSASLALVRGIHRWPVNSPHKGPVTVENISIWWRYHGNLPLKFGADVNTFMENKRVLCSTLLICSLWYVQMIGYIMACRSCSFVANYTISLWLSCRLIWKQCTTKITGYQDSSSNNPCRAPLHAHWVKPADFRIYAIVNKLIAHSIVYTINWIVGK